RRGRIAAPMTLDYTDTFPRRHLGPSDADVAAMLATLGYDSLDALSRAAIPEDVRLDRPLNLPPPKGEFETLKDLRTVAEKNEVWRSYIGLGYHDCIVPPVVQRNILENPGWYTQYTPYQAEISQGRLEALLNFQTMICDLTGMEISNSSMLDEATAAAEAMTLLHRVEAKTDAFWVSDKCHPQTIALVQTRARPLGIEVIVGGEPTKPVFGVLVQYPDTTGAIPDHREFARKAHDAGARVVVATDLLALCMLAPPGEWGADVVIGNSQRFGVPMGFGGPHAGFMATRDEFKRQMPGRLVGVSKDAHGMPAMRLALQTREQHIRREKATSNICTAQVLLAIMAGMYAVWHGPKGLRAIAERVHRLTCVLAQGLKDAGLDLGGQPFFDTLKVRVGRERKQKVQDALRAKRINLREYPDGDLGIALDETVSARDVDDLLACFGAATPRGEIGSGYRGPHLRSSGYLKHETFSRYHAEHEFLRYVHRLQAKDLSLTTSMIPLGSCTMKLNATSEMLPVTWGEFGGLHPFAPAEQSAGYRELFRRLEAWLSEITGFFATSLQPNAGSQGEYAGLLVIRAYHESRGDAHRDVCLIPMSAHGTNPASASMAGLRVVPVKVDDHGAIDVNDLRAKAAQNAKNLAAIMVTYPSTAGVFEARVTDVCKIVHEHGGQVYLDGANLNAQCGLARPGDYGADVCHINLHKTFCIPHGGGGPGMGPIAVAKHLAPFLPGHPLVETGGEKAIGPVSAAPWGSPSILTISYVYIAMMGGEGLKKASQVAVLNANYMAKRLEPYFPTLYKGKGGLVAHEFIADLRACSASAGIGPVDVAKRLMDYGFHAPTMSWPVPGTLMIEPTESESKAELDRLCDALIAIHGEIKAIEEGRSDRENNALKNAPHTAHAIAASEWNHPYSREEAAFPAEWTRRHKYWPPVGRIDDAYGDRHLVCACGDVSEYA
ncbi:MAG TPA: aminomethyl-transferring glycine dehydrogenase, partial [Gemmatimonadaceae bacterium]|nr:aminomethyl-transferring glycine dehydrogenase [Gemmatimonadaceae bacterium]